MNLKVKYPQKFKKQHKKRVSYLMSSVNLSTGVKTGRLALAPTQQVVLPKQFITFIRKLLRKFFKRKKIACWFNIQPNKLFTSKSKNSRMGKGVGAINRTGFQVTAMQPILIISNISKSRMGYLVRLLQSRCPVVLRVVQI